MVAAVKAILIAMISTVALFLIVQLVFFFPFYMTIVVETFNLANVGSNDNYVKQMYYDSTLDSLKDRPIFKKLPGDVSIEVITTDEFGREWDAIGDDSEFAYSDYEGEFLPSGTHKPYLQRGNPVTVTISAVYPLEMTLWDRTITFRVPVSFTMTSIGLKYYKDLEWDI